MRHLNPAKLLGSILAASFFLWLLLSSVPTTELRPTQAAEPQVGAVPPARSVESLNALNGIDTAEWSSFDFAVGEPADPQDGPLSVFSGSSVPSVVQPPASDWHVECVDCPRQFRYMTDRSLQMDGEGHPHIVYGEDHLYHAWHDGTRWHYETVDESSSVGYYASLALDGAGQPHISYHDGWSNNNLKYAWRDGTNWHIETVDSEGRVGEYTSLALDGAGLPHISYYDYDNHDLKHAWYDGTNWHIETVDREGGRCTSLALDETGRPHISYGGSALKYAWHNGTNWQIETVDREGGGYTSLALDGPAPHQLPRLRQQRHPKVHLAQRFSLADRDGG